MNKKNFEITKQLLRNNVKHVNMDYWSTGEMACDKVGGKLQMSYEKCNTTGCIAGHIQAYVDGFVPYDSHSAFEVARKFLDVSEEDANIIFGAWEWPSVFETDLLTTLNDTKNSKEYVEVICERLDYFMETGK